MLTARKILPVYICEASGGDLYLQANNHHIDDAWTRNRAHELPIETGLQVSEAW